MNPGTRIGPYEITAALGAGGMGEVYRARDTQLNRDVALKVLPETLATDAERMARFEQEARSLASLNHPNIAQVYGLERGDATVIVMELVEGEDLAARLEQGPLPLDDLLPIARQIAEALEAAHEAGIVHRDLKPANVRVRPDGTAKVLDFGLAKSTEGKGAASGSAADSPTIMSPAVTGVGVIMGTAAYMAPEQARGKPVDRRADVWAFGCLLFELICGQRAFRGDDVSMTLASVLKKDIDWDTLPADTPAPLRRMIERCLEVDPRRRYQSIGDARVQIEDWIHEGFDVGFDAGLAVAKAGSGAGAARRSGLLAGGAVLLTLAAAAGGWMLRAPAEAPLRIVPLDLESGAEDAGGGDHALLSPDGRAMLFRRDRVLWLRQFDEPELRLLAQNATAMDYSPDGLEVAYSNDGETSVLSLQTGNLRKLFGTMPLAPYGLHWAASGRILESRGGSFGLAGIDPATGEATQLLSVDGDTTRYLTPWELPDGSVMYSLLGRGRIEVFDGAERHLLYDMNPATVEGALYDAATGRVIWAQWGTNAGVWAAPFSLEERSFTGDAVRLWEHAGSVAVSGELMLIVPHGPRAFAAAAPFLVRRDGTTIRQLLPAQALLRKPRVSPDGRRLAIVAQSSRTADARIFVHDLENETSIELATTAPRGNIESVAWLPDSSRIVYASPDHSLVIEDVTGGGTPRVVVAEGVASRTLSVSADGRYLLYAGTDGDIWHVDPEGGEPVPFRRTDDMEDEPALSPDGRYLAYSRESTTGTSGLLVERFPEGGNVQVLETTNWDFPVWSPDGTEIYTSDGAGILAFGFDPESGRLTERYGRLFAGLAPLGGFDVTADGDFIVPYSADARGDGELPPAVLIENWQKLLAR